MPQLWLLPALWPECYPCGAAGLSGAVSVVDRSSGLALYVMGVEWFGNDDR